VVGRNSLQGTHFAVDPDEGIGGAGKWHRGFVTEGDWELEIVSCGEWQEHRSRCGWQNL